MTIFEKLAPGIEPPKGMSVKPPLTDEEQAVYIRCTAFIAPMLNRHGIGLASTDIPWVAADVADFVLSELALAAAAQVVVPSAPVVDDPKAKPRVQ